MPKSENKKYPIQVHRIFCILILLLSLSNCGFQVIYKENNAEIPYQQELAAIKIKKDRTRTDQEVKNNLYDLLNPEYLKVEPKYFLVLTTQNSYLSTFTTSTGSSGRNKVFLNINYELKSLETGDTISSGSVSLNDNYDVEANRFGTYTAEAYTKSNLTKVAAQNIRNALVNDLIEVKRKADIAAEEKACEEESN